MDLELDGIRIQENLSVLSIRKTAMKPSLNNCRFRKFAPIDREYPIFELVHEQSQIVFFDMGATNTGVLEVAIHQGAVNGIVNFDELMLLLKEGQRLVEKDLEEEF